MSSYHSCRFCNGKGCLACPGEKLKAEAKEAERRLNKNPLSESDARFASLVLDAINSQPDHLGQQREPVSFVEPNQPRYENGRYRDCPKCRGIGCVSCPEEAEAEYNRQFPDGPKPIATINIDPSDPNAVENAVHGFLEEIDDQIKAPWTAKQVQNLEAHQCRLEQHPYTCGNCSGHGEFTLLIPHQDGWYCPRCDFTVQDWAHSSDVMRRDGLDTGD